MLSSLVWLRLHPITILLGYGISWGWFDGLFAALLPKRASDLIHHRFFRAWLSQQDRDAFENGSASVDFARRLEEDNPYTFDAGRWHDAVGVELDARFVCQIEAFDGECPTGSGVSNLSYKDDPKACKKLLNEEWTYREADNKCYVVPKGRSTWYAAGRCCDSIGAKLASIFDESANSFVQQLCANNEGLPKGNERPFLLDIINDVCWIGLSKEGATWVWQDGTVLGTPDSWKSYQNWDGYEGRPKDQPDSENHVFMIPIDSRWDDGYQQLLIILVIISLAVILPIWIAIHIIYTCQYKKKVTDNRPALPAVESGTLHPSLVIVYDFKYGLCDHWCWQDCDMCLQSWCCLSTLVADTHSTAGTGRTFWFIFTVFEVAFFLEQFINAIEGFAGLDLNPGWILGGAIRCCIMVKLRQDLRKKFGGPQSSCCTDCLLWWFCCYCAACQEAKQVDEAQSRKIRCCCNPSEWHAPHTQMVGQPFGMNGFGQPMQPMSHMSQQQPGVVTVVGQPVAMANPGTQKVPYGVAIPQPTVCQAVVTRAPVQAQAVPVTQAQVVAPTMK